MSKSVIDMSAANFTVLVAQIKRLGKITNQVIQRGAVYAVYQSIEHRNSTPADNLLQALPAGSRRQSLVAYFEKHGNLCYSTAEKKMSFFDVEDMTGVALPEFDEPKLMATPWHAAIKEADITSAWDVRDQLDRLLTKLERASDHNTREVLNGDLLAKVREVLAAGNIE